MCQHDGHYTTQQEARSQLQMVNANAGSAKYQTTSWLFWVHQYREQHYRHLLCHECPAVAMQLLLVLATATALLAIKEASAAEEWSLVFTAAAKSSMYWTGSCVAACESLQWLLPAWCQFAYGLRSMLPLIAYAMYPPTKPGLLLELMIKVLEMTLCIYLTKLQPVRSGGDVPVVVMVFAHAGVYRRTQMHEETLIINRMVQINLLTVFRNLTGACAWIAH